MSKCYKYCIVPMCSSTTISTPEKIFINVPNNKDARKRWCIAMNRDLRKNPPLSEQSVRHVCEDHFDVEKDVENYIRVKLQGVKVRLRDGVLPHKFECQKQTKVAPSTERAEKRQRLTMIKEILHQPSTSSDVNNIIPNLSAPVEEVDIIPNLPAPVTEVVERPLTLDKGVQYKYRVTYRSKGTNTPPIEDVGLRFAAVSLNTSPKIIEKENTACVPLPETVKINSASCVPLPEKVKENESSESSESERETHFSDEDPDYVDDGDPGSDYEPEEDKDEEKKQMRTCMVRCVMNETLMCLGIPQKISFIVDFLASKSKCPTIDVMITLKKIRLNESFAYLGMVFGMSTSNVARIFHKTLFALASVLQNLIFMPDAETIQRCLPIAFRARYANTHCIVDCFEIQIEKPSDSQHQGLTWSDYKKCNTLKYLASCTPDGIVTFVSKGYGGRTTDAIIVEESGFLDNLLPNLDVMADRGFKNISHLLEAKRCKIVRPPSVSADQPMTCAEVKSSRRIAALRIHVERLIRRFREFHMCVPHATIDHNLIPIFDYVIITVGGLINLQSNLIKT